MKQLKVTEKCSGCGLCVIQSQYLEEDEDGNARAILGKRILEEDMEEVKKVIEQCPKQALVLEEHRLTKKSGKEGLRDLIKELEKIRDIYKVPEVKREDIAFSMDDYWLEFHLSYNMDSFPSKGVAKDFARSEFKRICYSDETAEASMRKVYIEYKVKKLKPFYVLEPSNYSFYTRYNVKIEEKLQEFALETEELTDGATKLEREWTEFKVYPNVSQTMHIEEFDDNAVRYLDILDVLKKGEYTNLSWYMDKMDYDCQEEYMGEGLFGISKFANRWYVEGINDAMFEFKDDLTKAMRRNEKCITDYAMQFVGYALSDYEKQVKKELEQKIVELKKMCESFG